VPLLGLAGREGRDVFGSGVFAVSFWLVVGIPCGGVAGICLVGVLRLALLRSLRMTGFFLVRRTSLFGVFGQVLFGVVGNFADHVVLAKVEVEVAGISYRDVEGFEDEVGALVVHGAFEDGVDGVHEGGLDGFGAFDEGDGMDLGVDAGLHSFDHAGVEVAEVFLFEGGGAAAVSGDLDVSAAANVRMQRHGYIPRKSRFSPKSMN